MRLISHMIHRIQSSKLIELVLYEYHCIVHPSLIVMTYGLYMIGSVLLFVQTQPGVPISVLHYDLQLYQLQYTRYLVTVIVFTQIIYAVIINVYSWYINRSPYFILSRYSRTTHMWMKLLVGSAVLFLFTLTNGLLVTVITKWMRPEYTIEFVSVFFHLFLIAVYYYALLMLVTTISRSSVGIVFVMFGYMISFLFTTPKEDTVHWALIIWNGVFPDLWFEGNRVIFLISPVFVLAMTILIINITISLYKQSDLVN